MLLRRTRESRNSPFEFRDKAISSQRLQSGAEEITSLSMSNKPSNHRTFRFAVLALLGSLCILPNHASGVPPTRAAAKSDVEKLDEIVSDHRQKGVQFGASVIDLSTGKALYSKNAEVPLMPASNMKLVVMAAALDRLGADYQFETIVGIRGKDLVIIGGGDPTLGDERLSERRGERITSVLMRWVDQIKKAGVKQIPGNIVIDDSLFDRKFTHPNWPADQFESWYELGKRKSPHRAIRYPPTRTSV